MTISDRDLQHTSGGPETLADEYAVLTAEEWYAVEDVVLQAMCAANTVAERAESEGCTLTTGVLWRHTAQAAAALAILRGVRERTFQSHYPALYSTRQAVAQHATVDV